MDDYIPEESIPHYIFESLVTEIQFSNGQNVKALTAPTTFFDHPDDQQPIIIGFAGTVYISFNEDLVGTCEEVEQADEPAQLCACSIREISFHLGRAYMIQHQQQLGFPSL